MNVVLSREDEMQPPVVVGGIGGSGTRLIAAALKELGFYMGGDLNSKLDNRWFTLLFRRMEVLDSTDEAFSDLVDIFVQAMRYGAGFDRDQVDFITGLEHEVNFQKRQQWIKDRIETLLSARDSITGHKYWGWKEPNSHIFLDRLVNSFPGMKYIHVMRNGLDMAFSRNQRQLQNWGGRLLNSKVELTPYYSLKFWCAVHKRIIQIGSRLDGRFLLLNYDAFCSSPEPEITRLLEFLETEDGPETRGRVAGLIEKPETIGRYLTEDPGLFDPEDVRYVGEMGFDITGI